MQIQNVVREMYKLFEVQVLEKVVGRGDEVVDSEEEGISRGLRVVQ